MDGWRKRDFVQPIQPPYYDEYFFAAIKMVKDEGLLNLETMSTHRLAEPGRQLVPCRAESKNPELD